MFVDGRPVDSVHLTEPLAVQFGDLSVDPVYIGLVSDDPPAVVRIGRADDNDMIVASLMVADHHAELRWDGFGWSITDLDTVSGTFVDGRRCDGTQEVHFGQRITLGNQRFVITRSGAVRHQSLTGADEQTVRAGMGGESLGDSPGSEHGADAPPALEARGVTVEVARGGRILDNVSIAVAPGEVLAIVGPSGSGKSTLLKALTGSRRPEAGEVRIRGTNLYEAYDELSRTIGYVPQEDILHYPLSVRQALEFGAELRFPMDTAPLDRSKRVDDVMEELSLARCADVPVAKVSGGQRKRTSVALELLTGPEVLFLDEPTSGLDPGLERTVMELLRSLASAGRAVIVVTHSLQSLDLCDRVLFLAPGGRVAYCGDPSRALEFFGEPDFISVFRLLEALPTAAPDGQDTIVRAQVGHDMRPAVPISTPEWRRQVAILCRRQLAILRADRQNLGFLLGAVAVPAVLIVLLMGSDALRLGQTDPVDARTILGAIVVSAVAIGTANSVREIVKEMPIYLRERAIGLRRSAYLASKVVVIGALTTAQVCVLVIVATSRAGGPDRANLLVNGRVELALDVVLTGLSAVALGLLLSTMVSSSEKAMALIPVVFVVQWLLCGAGLDLEAKPVMRDVGRLTAANWGVAASASTVAEHRLSHTCSDPPKYGPGYGSYSQPAVDDYGMPDAEEQERRADERADREKEQARRDAAPSCDARWRQGPQSWLPSVLALLALTIGAVALADRSLARREPLSAQRKNDWPRPGSSGVRRPI